MMDRGREASVIVCDEVRFEITGKLIIVGAYTRDIGIALEEQLTPIIQFLFHAECEYSDPFKFIRFEVTLPGEEPVIAEAEMGPPPAIAAERTRVSIYHVVSIPNAVLRPGKITANVIHDKGEIPVSAMWITKIDQPDQETVAPIA